MFKRMRSTGQWSGTLSSYNGGIRRLREMACLFRKFISSVESYFKSLSQHLAHVFSATFSVHRPKSKLLNSVVWCALRALLLVFFRCRASVSEEDGRFGNSDGHVAPARSHALGAGGRRQIGRGWGRQASLPGASGVSRKATKYSFGHCPIQQDMMSLSLGLDEHLCALWALEVMQIDVRPQLRLVDSRNRWRSCWAMRFLAAAAFYARVPTLSNPAVAASYPRGFPYFTVSETVTLADTTLLWSNELQRVW